MGAAALCVCAPRLRPFSFETNQKTATRYAIVKLHSAEAASEKKAKRNAQKIYALLKRK